jgi:hypothetical protein
VRMSIRRYGEAGIYGGLLVGLVLCVWLFTVILPALGFGEFARRFEAYADKAAPCLLSPIVAWLVVRLRERGTLPFVLALIGGVAFLFWFFVIYEPLMVIVWAAVMGVGVGLGFRAYRRAVAQAQQAHATGRADG